MSAQAGWLERLLDWVIGAARDVRSPCGPADNASLFASVQEPTTDDVTSDVRRDREREIELRVLMSTWM
jgi:hypothetical protein